MKDTKDKNEKKSETVNQQSKTLEYWGNTSENAKRRQLDPDFAGKQDKIRDMDLERSLMDTREESNGNGW